MVSIYGAIMNHTLNKNGTANTSTTAGRQLCNLGGTWAHTYAAMLMLLAVVATVENLVVVVAMVRYKPLQKPSILLIAALAMVDLITSLLVTPMYAHLVLHPHARWRGAARALLVTFVVLSLFTVSGGDLFRFIHHMLKFII